MKKFWLLGLIILASACSTYYKYRTPASLGEAKEEGFIREGDEFKEKSFLDEYENATSPLGKTLGRLKVFVTWLRTNPIPMFDEIRNSAKPSMELVNFPGVFKLVKNEKGLDGKRLYGPTRISKPPMVLVTKDKDVRELLDNPEIFSVRLYTKKMEDSVQGPYMLSQDRTKYNEEKAWMREMLTPAEMPRVKQIVKRLTQQAIREHTVHGRIDLVNSVARKVPLQLSGEFFGLPGPDLRTMYRWSRSNQYSFFHNPTNKDEINEKAKIAGQEMFTYLKDFIEAKKASGDYKSGQTVLDRLLIKNVDTQELLFMYDGRLETNMMGTLIGGVETTQAAIVQAVEFFLDNNGENGRRNLFAEAKKAAQTDNDQLLAQYIWEALRFRPVNPIVMRLALADYTLGKGTPSEYLVKKGQVVLAGTQSAMFDPERVKNPYEFRTDRGPVNGRNSVYFHFGYGHHKCLGDYIAEVEVVEVVKQILLLDGLRKVDGIIGRISRFDNIGALEEEEDQEKSPFPEMFVVEYSSSTPKDQLTIADPRFAFEDYLLSYDRNEFRKCLSSANENTRTLDLRSIGRNIKRRRDKTDALDLFLCRLPRSFKECVGNPEKKKGEGTQADFNRCKEHLTEVEKFFYGTEVFGEPLDLSKVPGNPKVSVNTGMDFEEIFKFYDRANYRQTFMNPKGLTSFPISDPQGSEKLIFYARIDLELRKCIAPRVIKREIQGMDKAQARKEGFEECMQNENIKLDDFTVQYYRKLILE